MSSGIGTTMNELKIAQLKAAIDAYDARHMLADNGTGGAGSSGDGGSEGAGNTPSPGQGDVDPGYSQYVDQCMADQGADVAGEIAAAGLPLAPVPKTKWELGRTLGGGARDTTWASRGASAMGLPARNGLRTAGAIAAKITAIPVGAAGGYWFGSLLICSATYEAK
jgi:hypothetical protein